MKPFFKELFEYSYHFNQKLCEVLNNNSHNVPEKSVNLFNHILNAHQIWNNRIDPRQPVFGVWGINPIQDLKGIDQTNYEHTLQILDAFELNKIISYKNSKGERFSNSIRDVLFHVINHSTYHRGQISAEFRKNGIDPLVTDYVFYKR